MLDDYKKKRQKFYITVKKQSKWVIVIGLFIGLVDYWFLFWSDLSNFFILFMTVMYGLVSIIYIFALIRYINNLRLLKQTVNIENVASTDINFLKKILDSNQSNAKTASSLSDYRILSIYETEFDLLIEFNIHRHHDNWPKYKPYLAIFKINNDEIRNLITLSKNNGKLAQAKYIHEGLTQLDYRYMWQQLLYIDATTRNNNEI